MKTIARQLAEKEYQALIFDLDGTLVDSMPAHFKAWCAALAEQGQAGVFPEDVFYAMGGRPTRDIVEIINGEQGTNMDPDVVAISKKKHFLKLLGEVVLIPEVAEIVQAHCGRVKMAVASGGSREVVEKTLQKLGISDWFHEVVTSSDVVRGKPEPDIFLEAAKRLEVDPSECVVFEDAQPGIESARKAGMEVIVVPTHIHLD